jgi:hypothetical protein
MRTCKICQIEIEFPRIKYCSNCVVQATKQQNLLTSKRYYQERREVWKQLSQEKKDELIAKWRIYYFNKAKQNEKSQNN